MLLKEWINNSPRQAVAYLAAAFAHILFLCNIDNVKPSSIALKPPNKSLRVQTVTLQPVKTPPAAKAANNSRQTIAESKPAPALIKKNDPKKPPLQKKEAPIVKKEPAQLKHAAEKPKETQKKPDQKQVAKKEKSDKQEPAKTAPLAKTDLKKMDPPKPKASEPKTVKQPIPLCQESEEDEEIAKLLIKAKESVAKINTSAPKISPAADQETSKVIGKLNIDTDPLSPGTLEGKSGYQDELVKRLQLMLKLPEYGDVKIELTLDKSGKVVKVSVISAASARNRNYIEEKVVSLSFPAFGSQFLREDTHTFRLTFSNE